VHDGLISFLFFSSTTTIVMRFLFLSLLVLPACAGGSDAAAKTKGGIDSIAASSVGAAKATDTAASAGSPSQSAGSQSAEIRRLRTDVSAPIRALYINRFAAQSSKRMKSLIAVADSTEINAFVVDLKDEFASISTRAIRCFRRTKARRRRSQTSRLS
jgi:hypothetical protein